MADHVELVVLRSRQIVVPIAEIGVTNCPIHLTIRWVRHESRSATVSRRYGALTLDVIDAMTPVALLKAS